MRTDTLKNGKSVKELKVGDSERRDRRSWGGTDVKEGKTDYEPFLAFHSTTVIILSFILTPEVPCRLLGAFIHAIP